MSKRSYHTGRLLDHVHIVVSNIETSRAFYKAVLHSIGRGLTYQSGNDFESDELFVSQCQEGDRISSIHLAFQAPDRATVDAFYRAALAAGGTDNGPPGERLYHPGYYSAFVLDPDGNNVESVFHGPSERSSESVIVIRAS